MAGHGGADRGAHLPALPAGRGGSGTPLDGVYGTGGPEETAPTWQEHSRVGGATTTGVGDAQDHPESPRWLTTTTTAAATSSAQKITSLREFISSSNAEFKTCSDTCSGVEKCDCIAREWERFDFHFKANFEPSEGITVQFKGNLESPICYVKAFSFYLNENGYHKELNCTNIMRVLEQISLMKPSQSGTERVMSYVANTVKNRFESKL